MAGLYHDTSSESPAAERAKKRDGFVALVTVLVISAIILTIGLFISAASLNELLGGFYFDQSERTLQIADACIDEAVFRLKKDATYVGGTLSLNNGSCTATVSGSGTTRTINSVATQGSFTKRVRADVTLVTNSQGSSTSIDITHFEEI